MKHVTTIENRLFRLFKSGGFTCINDWGFKVRLTPDGSITWENTNDPGAFGKLCPDLGPCKRKDAEVFIESLDSLS